MKYVLKFCMICEEEMPKELADAIRHVEELGKKSKQKIHSCSSISITTTEDLPDASCGQVYLNVRKY